jgi:hypothetical protein
VSERVKENASKTMKTYLIPEFWSPEWFLKEIKEVRESMCGSKKKASNGSNASYLIPKFRTKKKERNILVKK